MIDSKILGQFDEHFDGFLKIHPVNSPMLFYVEFSGNQKTN